MSNEIDLSQFYSIFIEESSELLEEMEAGLLKLELGDLELEDDETVNTIFRAAHSIKGSGATLGFSEIADFTHGVEALLEGMRSGEQAITNNAVSLLLECVDCLRGMIKNCSTGEGNDQSLIDKLNAELELLPRTESEADEGKPDGRADLDGRSDPGKQPKTRVWSILFRPHPELFFTGNDPFRLLRALAELGDLEVQLDTGALPDFTDLDPEQCYLAWDLTLTGDVDEEQIREEFAWVEEDCDLSLSLLEESSDSLAADAADDRADNALKEDSDQSSTEPAKNSEDAAGPSTSAPGSSSADQKKVRPTGQTNQTTDGFGEETSSIRVSTDKVDELVNLVGELVITQSILSQAVSDLGSEQLSALNNSLQQLERNTRDLQEQALNIRMLPISFAFQRLPRIVHDLNRTLGKQVKLKFSGENTELDKTVLEKIGDPLVHLVRNALDHGIEAPDARHTAGKDEYGSVHVKAFHQGGNIVIEVSDDGAGLDAEKILNKAREKSLINGGVDLTEEQIQNLIFEPGFTTAAEVSNISGRGVGMDVVRRNISDLGGRVDVRSKLGEGTTFTIKLPLTLAILDGQMVRVGGQVFIIPLLAIVESVKVGKHDIHQVAGEAEVYKYREECLPVVRLNQVLSVGQGEKSLEGGLLVIVEVDGQLVGLSIDDILGQQQVVIKSLQKNFREVPGISGATILGDGSVALIIDVPTVIQLNLDQVAA